jgi:hypothetical protein
MKVDSISKQEIQNEISSYNKRVQELYSNVKKWLANHSDLFPRMQFKEIDILRREELSGEYRTTKLTILSEEDKVAELIPGGIWIIAAFGRLDLVGKSGSEVIVYLSEGGPHTQVTTSGLSSSMTPDYESIKEGWHWIDNRLAGEAEELTEKLFISLIKKVN